MATNGNANNGGSNSKLHEAPKQIDTSVGVTVTILTPTKNKKLCINFSRSLQMLTLPIESAIIIRDQLNDAIKLLEKV